MTQNQYESPLFFLNTQTAYGTYSRHLARAYGLPCACMLAELIKQQHIHRDSLVTHPKKGPGWFYDTMGNIEYQTGLTRKDQDAAIKKLVKFHLIEILSFGLPCRRYFRLNEQEIVSFFEKLTNRKWAELPDCPKVQTRVQNGKKTPNSDTQVCTIVQTGLHDRADLPIIYRKETSIKEPKKKKEYAPTFGTNCSPETAGGNAPPDGGAHSHSFRDSFYTQSDSSQSAADGPVEKKIERAPQVATTESEHKKLLALPGVNAKLVQEAYDDLAEWKESATPAQVKKHSSDYRRLRKWVIPELLDEKQKTETRQRNKLAPHRRNSKLAIKQDLEDDDYDWSPHVIV